MSSFCNFREAKNASLVKDSWVPRQQVSKKKRRVPHHLSNQHDTPRGTTWPKKAGHIPTYASLCAASMSAVSSLSCNNAMVEMTTSMPVRAWTRISDGPSSSMGLTMTPRLANATYSGLSMEARRARAVTSGESVNMQRRRVFALLISLSQPRKGISTYEFLGSCKEGVDDRGALTPDAPAMATLVLAAISCALFA